MIGAQTLVEMLKQYRVEVIFGVPGDTSILLYEALYDAQPGIRHIMARDERSASFMADAYARLSHKPGICECPSGAGSLYSIPGVAEANASSIPVILLTMDIPLAGEGKQTITELDTRKLFESITKWSNVLKDVSKIPEVIRRAFRIATTGRPGAVHLAFPQEALSGVLLIMVTSLVMGMGLPCTPAYIIAITIGGPALLAMGTDMLPAHLFVYYFAVLAGVTPPVCVPAFCAASIAKSKPLQTGFEAFKLALAGFLIPYVFVFNQALLMRGTPFEIITVTLWLLVAIILFAGALSRYFFRPLNLGFQVILFVLAGLTTFLCAKPDLLNSPMVRILGILILAGILLRPLWSKAGAAKAISHEPNA